MEVDRISLRLIFSYLSDFNISKQTRSHEKIFSFGISPDYFTH
jgi:hypothetical protein